MPLFGLLGLGGGSGNSLISGPSGADLDSSGGTKITSGENVYHVFTSDGNLVISSDGSGEGYTAMEIVVIGGGGGGGRGGGGGAGGIIQAPGAPIVAATMAVDIGPGGLGNNGSANGDAGTNSTFAHPAGTMTGYGGGKGGGTPTAVPTLNGGSGGGAGIDTGLTEGGEATQPGHPGLPYTTNNFGQNGGGAPQAQPYQAGGGGGGAEGAGAVGQRQNINPTASRGGPGGNGHPFPNFGNPVIGPAVPSPTEPIIGPTGLFAGGGGGGNNLNNPTSGTRPTGGPGGGGVGGGPHDDSPGGDFGGTSYGGGGGGKEAEPPGVSGGNGYQGIVMVRIYKG